MRAGLISAMYMGEVMEAAHAEAAENAKDDEQAQGGRHGGPDSRDEEEHRRQDQDLLAAEPVAQRARAGRPEGAAQQGTGRRPALLHLVQGEMGLQRADGPVDDAGVVAEQQTPQGGDDGDQEDIGGTADLPTRPGERTVVNRHAPGGGFGIAAHGQVTSTTRILMILIDVLVLSSARMPYTGLRSTPSR
jgi:hypothetical protein